jgi:metastasis-associated protein MTA
MQEYLFSDYKFNDVEKHQLTHREVFLSRQIETVNASLIRGKCSVRILSEAENMQQYIKDPDTFYYSLVFDPKQKTLLADGGDIRIGAKVTSRK